MSVRQSATDTTSTYEGNFFEFDVKDFTIICRHISVLVKIEQPWRTLYLLYTSLRMSREKSLKTSQRIMFGQV